METKDAAANITEEKEEKDVTILDKNEENTSVMMGGHIGSGLNENDEKETNEIREVKEINEMKFEVNLKTEMSETKERGEVTEDSDLAMGNNRISTLTGDVNDVFDGDELLEPFPSFSSRDRRNSTSGGNQGGKQGNSNGDGEEGIGSDFEDAKGDRSEDDVLRPGDHVFTWIGRTRSHQRHGIIMSVEHDDEWGMPEVTVATFYNREEKGEEEDDVVGEDEFDDDKNIGSNVAYSKYIPQKKGDNIEADDEGGGVGYNDSTLDSDDETPKTTGRSYPLPPKQLLNTNSKGKIGRNSRTETIQQFVGPRRSPIHVRKVRYGATIARRLLRRAGTATSCIPDEPGLILHRLTYLMNNPKMLPPHNSLSANTECVAVWCRTGRWATLQAASILHLVFLGHAGSAVAGGVVASNFFLWVPVPGVWGTLGYWWYVPAAVAYPILIPLLVGFGLASLGPLEVLRRSRNKWRIISTDLNQAFWLQADDDVRERYFGSSQSSDVDWVTNFFGGSADTNRNDQGNDVGDHTGKYMPLGLGDGMDADDSDDDEDGRRLRDPPEYTSSAGPSIGDRWRGAVHKVSMIRSSLTAAVSSGHAQRGSASDSNFSSFIDEDERFSRDVHDGNGESNDHLRKRSSRGLSISDAMSNNIDDGALGKGVPQCGTRINVFKDSVP